MGPITYYFISGFSFTVGAILAFIIGIVVAKVICIAFQAYNQDKTKMKYSILIILGLFSILAGLTTIGGA